MSKEQQELLDDAYKNYYNYMRDDRQWELDKEEFINKIKTDPEFSNEWGLTIEEQIVLEQVEQNNPVLKRSTALYPTKLITITYNDKTIKSYE